MQAERIRKPVRKSVRKSIAKPSIKPSVKPLKGRRSQPLVMVEMVFPTDTNHYGTLFGGKVLDLMDRAAFLAATRFTKEAIVTASTERIDFFRPIKSGHLVELRAQIIYSGKTSVTVKVDLFAENPLRGYREQASRGYFHMVAVSEDGKPVPITPLRIESEEEKRDWAYAAKLREDSKRTRP